MLQYQSRGEENRDQQCFQGRKICLRTVSQRRPVTCVSAWLYIRGQEDGAAYNLRKIKGVVSDGVEDEILKPVDHRQKLLSQGRHAPGGSEAVKKWKRTLCQRNLPA